MTKKKPTLAEYGGLADLAAARQGRGATHGSSQRPAPEAGEAPARPDIQISAFIPAGTYRRVKVALAEDGLTMRELVCQLLDEWLAKRP